MEVLDGGSGVNPATVAMTINGITYTVTDGELLWDASAGRLTFLPSQFGDVFKRGDTVWVNLNVSDNPDYCAPNVATGDCGTPTAPGYSELISTASRRSLHHT